MPFHRTRIWQISDAKNSAELAYDLTQRSWTLCTAFRLGPWLFLNDATSEDGASEWAIVNEATGTQVESVTFGWMTEERALYYIDNVLMGDEPPTFDMGHVDPAQLQTADEHGSCWACA